MTGRVFPRRAPADLDGLQATIDAADPCDTIALPEGATIDLGGRGLLITKPIRLLGRCATLHQSVPTVTPILDFTADASGSSVVNLACAGAKPPEVLYTDELGDRNHGIQLRSVSNIWLEDVSVRDVFGDGIYLGHFYGGPAAHIVICRPRLYDLGRAGISAVSAADVHVQSPRLGRIARSGINLEAHPGHQVRRFTAVDVEMGPVRLNTLAATGRGDVEDLVVEGVRLTDPAKGPRISIFGRRDGASYGHRRRITLRDWSAARAPQDGDIRFHHVEDLVLDGFPFAFDARPFGYRLDGLATAATPTT